MIDACFFALMASFSGFPLRQENGKRAKSNDVHCVYSPYTVRIQENTDQRKLRIWTLFTQGLSLEDLEIERSNHVCKMKYPCTCETISGIHVLAKMLKMPT